MSNRSTGAQNIIFTDKVSYVAGMANILVRILITHEGNKRYTVMNAIKSSRDTSVYERDTHFFCRRWNAMFQASLVPESIVPRASGKEITG